jgi:hypothetical protein
VPTSIVRTVVPIVVGYFLALPVVRLLGLTHDQAVGLVTALLTAVYYAGARTAEHYFPAAGWLLGIATAPVYPTPPAVTAAPTSPGV